MEMNFKKIFLYSIVISLIITALVGIIILLVGKFDSFIIVNSWLYSTVLCVIIITGMLMPIVYHSTSDLDFPKMYYRILGVFAILTALGTIVTPILNKIYKK